MESLSLGFGTELIAVHVLKDLHWQIWNCGDTWSITFPGVSCPLSGTFRILYHFDWFVQHVTFSHFRKISENRKNREKIISKVRKKWVWCMTAESIEMVQYILKTGAAVQRLSLCITQGVNKFVTYLLRQRFYCQWLQTTSMIVSVSSRLNMSALVGKTDH